MKEKIDQNKIVIYKTANNEVALAVKFEKETVWLSLDQIAALFGRDKSVISRHLKNIFHGKELSLKSVVANFATTAADGKTYRVDYYNLDAIISVGYRVNSARATQFRIWATKILKKYLINGCAINEKRLLEAKEKFNELQTAIDFLQNKSKKELLAGQETEILNLLANYAKTLSLLENYDRGQIAPVKGTKTSFIMKYGDCLAIISKIKTETIAKKEAGDFFGLARDKSFEGIISGLYQTFGGKELYPSLEDKAAHLLYLIIKDHPFSDGNKRIGSFLFVYFLDKNKALYRRNYERKINDNALTALALLIAESDPKEKEIMVKIIKSLIAD